MASSSIPPAEMTETPTTETIPPNKPIRMASVLEHRHVGEQSRVAKSIFASGDFNLQLSDTYAYRYQFRARHSSRRPDILSAWSFAFERVDFDAGETEVLMARRLFMFDDDGVPIEVTPKFVELDVPMLAKHFVQLMALPSDRMMEGKPFKQDELQAIILIAQAILITLWLYDRGRSSATWIKPGEARTRSQSQNVGLLAEQIDGKRAMHLSSYVGLALRFAKLRLLHTRGVEEELTTKYGTRLMYAEDQSSILRPQQRIIGDDDNEAYMAAVFIRSLSKIASELVRLCWAAYNGSKNKWVSIDFVRHARVSLRQPFITYNDKGDDMIGPYGAKQSYNLSKGDNRIMVMYVITKPAQVLAVDLRAEVITTDRLSESNVRDSSTVDDYDDDGTEEGDLVVTELAQELTQISPSGVQPTDPPQHLTEASSQQLYDTVVDGQRKGEYGPPQQQEMQAAYTYPFTIPLYEPQLAAENELFNYAKDVPQGDLSLLCDLARIEQVAKGVSLEKKDGGDKTGFDM